MFEFGKNSKLKSDDRTLVLKPKEGQKAKSSTGLVDPRLFSGENKLHVIRTSNNLWYFKYDMGGLPEPLKEKFSSFDLALTHAKRYLAKRNVEVVEVIE